MNINHKLFAMPYSTARCVFSFANLKSQGSDLSSVKYRGIGEDEMATWRQDKQTCNLIKCCQEIEDLHVPSQHMYDTIFPDLIKGTLSAILCFFNRWTI